MPTFNTMRLNPPKSWDEFEDMCTTSFQLRWNVHNLSRHGRSGQEQFGVDIYGYDNSGHFVGIQCKNTVSKISKATIKNEISKAEKFKPELRDLYIATTAPRDANIQSFVREINEDRESQGEFLVTVVFWDDITNDLTRDERAVKQFYPEIFNKTEPTMEALLRKKDISNLKRLLEVIDFHATSEHLQWDAKYIHSLILDECSEVYDVYNSPIFQLNDKKLSNATDALVKAWVDLHNAFIKAPYNYVSHNNMFSFNNPGDFCKNQEDEDMYNEITALMRVLRKEVNDFCLFISSHYHELDINETSKCARGRY